MSDSNAPIFAVWSTAVLLLLVNTTGSISAADCDPSVCKLPDCFCYGERPTEIPLSQMPMFIMLTFDDAVNYQLFNDYYRNFMIDNDYQVYNPSGCPTKSTFYVLDEWTDYSMVTDLWNAGDEIGDHTVTHELPQGDKPSDYEPMVEEIIGMIDRVKTATGNQVLVDSIIGFRAPYLRVAGDVQFDVLRDYGFLYDSSILNIEILQGRDPMWPFTLDYVMPFCPNPPCPTKPYPGLWEVPLNGWIGDDGEGCSMADACIVGNDPWTATESDWYNYFKRNFDDYFDPIKVPFPIFIHGAMFLNYPNSYKALADWLETELMTRNDVWMVTPTQLITWMKDPKSNSDMIKEGWGC